MDKGGRLVNLSEHGKHNADEHCSRYAQRLSHYPVKPKHHPAQYTYRNTAANKAEFCKVRQAKPVMRKEENNTRQNVARREREKRLHGPTIPKR